eukprot:RCo046649
MWAEPSGHALLGRLLMAVVLAASLIATQVTSQPTLWIAGPQQGQSSSMPFTAQAVISSNVSCVDQVRWKFLWELYGVPSDAFSGAVLSSPFLTLAPVTLSSSVPLVYVLYVTAWDPADPLEVLYRANATFSLNLPPAPLPSGSASPSVTQEGTGSIVEASTYLLLSTTASTWLDPEGNTPLSFLFVYISDGLEFRFVDKWEYSIATSVRVMAPTLVGATNSCVIGLYVRDALNSTSGPYVNSDPIVVAPLPTNNYPLSYQSQWDQVNSAVRLARSSVIPQTMLQKLEKVTDALPTYPKQLLAGAVYSLSCLPTRGVQQWNSG